jgi:hypothetical protein
LTDDALDAFLEFALDDSFEAAVFLGLSLASRFAWRAAFDAETTMVADVGGVMGGRGRAKGSGGGAAEEFE